LYAPEPVWHSGWFYSLEMPTPRVAAELTDDGRVLAPAASIDRALGAFVAEHYDRLLRLAWLICRHGPDAADAVQLGLEQAWRQRASLRDEGLLRPWVDRVVVREAIRLGRRPWLRRVLSLDAQVGWVEPHSDAADPEEWLTFRAAFARLPADQRAAIALHLHAGYSVVETAAILGAPLETVRTRLRRAKDRLRTELGESPR
jgi:RNA polymerase sigma factor (sigma-70 family)